MSLSDYIKPGAFVTLAGVKKARICEYAWDHSPGETCPECKLPVDKYGNTENDFLHCSFPDCGCDGARLCMAGEANDDARNCNVEGMYTGKDAESLRARMALLALCLTPNPKDARLLDIAADLEKLPVDKLRIDE